MGRVGQRALVGILDTDFCRIPPQGLDECINGKSKWNEETNDSYMELIQKEAIWKEKGKKKKLDMLL